MHTETLHQIIKSREVFIQLLDQLNLEELNKIPTGFNNNIAWNFGHIVVSTDLLAFVRTGIWKENSHIPFVEQFKKGTKPEEPMSEETLELLKKQAFSCVENLKNAVEEGQFDQMQAFSTTTYFSEVKNTADLLATILAHDNLHYGYAMAQARCIK